MGLLMFILFCFALAVALMAFLVGLILNLVGSMSMAWAIGLVVFILIGAIMLFVEVVGDTRIYYHWVKEAKAKNDPEGAERATKWTLEVLSMLLMLPFASLAVVVYVVFILGSCALCVIKDTFNKMKTRVAK